MARNTTRNVTTKAQTLVTRDEAVMVYMPVVVQADTAVLCHPDGQSRHIPAAVDMLTVLPQLRHSLLCSILGIIL